MILLILILCILPVALSLDAFEIAQETAGDYRLSAARRFLMSFSSSMAVSPSIIHKPLSPISYKDEFRTPILHYFGGRCR